MITFLIVSALALGALFFFFGAAKIIAANKEKELFFIKRALKKVTGEKLGRKLFICQDCNKYTLQEIKNDLSILERMEWRYLNDLWTAIKGTRGKGLIKKDFRRRASDSAFDACHA